MTPPPSSSSPLSGAAAAVVVAAGATACVAALIFSRRRKEDVEARIAKLEETRQAERTGRIRAEMKLRTLLKDREQDQVASSSTDQRRGRGSEHGKEGGEEGPLDGNDGQAVRQEQHNLLMHCIGTIVSPYTKRMGTPRQGALVPSGRGYVQLKIPVECVEGLELYSHAWILFTFHANTDAPTTTTTTSSAKKKAKNKNGKNNGNGGGFMNLSKTKIRPPRGGGIKVGMLATRSPHRPNNIGLSLVRVVGIDRKARRLHIAALDLVNGTPVYDVKPCVPWDVPGHHDGAILSVPSWVSHDDELGSVEFAEGADESLERCVREGRLAPLYVDGDDGNDDGSSSSSSLGRRAARRAIREILAQDPRASNSNGPNRRGAAAAASATRSDDKNDTYKMLFCSVEVEFRVGGDGVIVENVRGVDLKGVRHVDGIPVLLDSNR